MMRDRAGRTPEVLCLREDSGDTAAEETSSGEESERGSEVSPEGDGKCRKNRTRIYADKNGVSENILYDTAFPAWRIEYNGGRIKYISAFEQ